MHVVKLLAIIILSSLFIFSCKDEPEANLSAVDQYYDDYDSPLYKWGYIDTTGQVVIEKKYDDLRPFNAGLAIANFDGKWGFIDKQGQTIIEHKYRAAFPYKDGLARVQNFDKKYGFIDVNGKMMIPDTFTQIFDFNSGRARVKKGEDYGYIDTEGNWVIEAFYKKCGNFENGYAVVYQFGKAALINPDGEKMIPLEAGYDKIYDISEGKIRVRKDGQFQFISTKDFKSISMAYDDATDFHGKFAAVKIKDEWMFIDDRYKVIQKFDAEKVKYANEQKWIVKVDSLYGLIDPNDNKQAQSLFDMIFPFSDGLAPFQQGEYWGYLDTDSKIVYPARLPLAWSFENGFARFINEGRIGYMSKKLNPAFGNTFIDAHDFSEGLAHVQ